MVVSRSRRVLPNQPIFARVCVCACVSIFFLHGMYNSKVNSLIGKTDILLMLLISLCDLN